MRWIPVFPLDLALLPGGEVPLHIFEPRYQKMIGGCMSDSNPFGIVRIHEGTLAAIGTEATVAKLIRRYPDGRFDILARGGSRVRIQQVREHADGYFEAETLPVVEDPEESDHALEDRVEETYRKLGALSGDLPTDPPPRGPRWSFRVADRLRLSVESRQELLELFSENERLGRIGEHLKEMIPILVRRERAQGTVRGNGRLKGGNVPEVQKGEEEKE